MKENYLYQLNESQKKAVLHKEGAIIVIAGAGSGKTRVLTYKIAHLIECGVSPFHILALTFTNKAAREMKGRVLQLVNSNEVKNIWMGTFHSIFARILRLEAHRLGYPSYFSIYDSQDALSVMKTVLKEMQLDNENYHAKTVLGRISFLKNNLITTKVYNNNLELQEYENAAKRPKFGEVYQSYVNRCFRNGAMDFDDLLLCTNEILTRFPDVLAKYQDKFRYILVDEYQDTNHSQYLIIKALASKFENLCVVGDDAQSIYGFRGANIQNILNFQKDYPEATIYRLEENYRSTKTIVAAANSLIKKNKYQLKKEIWTNNSTGSLIKVYRALSDVDESGFIAHTIHKEKEKFGRNYSEIAILYRTNVQSRAIEDALRKNNIPYKIYGGLSFYQRKEIKDLLAYLRLLINPMDNEAFIRIVNFPSRGIGNITIEKLRVFADKTGNSLFKSIEYLDKKEAKFNASTKNKLQEFYQIIKGSQVLLKDKDAFKTAQNIAKNSGLLKYHFNDKTPEGIGRYENLQEMLNAVHGYVEEQREIEAGDPSLLGFLGNIALSSTLDQTDENTDKISLMTVHMVKGLEFPVVFVTGLEENLFPSGMNSLVPGDLEEERRLFYVAMTRAEKKLFLSYAISRYRWGKLIENEPSIFIDEIQEKYLDKSQLLQGLKSSGIDISRTKTSSFGRIGKNSILKANKSYKRFSGVQPNEQLHKKITKGIKVLHRKFGVGIVESIEGKGNDSIAQINFINHGVKKLVLKFAQLKVMK